MAYIWNYEITNYHVSQWSSISNFGQSYFKAFDWSVATKHALSLVQTNSAHISLTLTLMYVNAKHVASYRRLEY